MRDQGLRARGLSACLRKLGIRASSSRVSVSTSSGRESSVLIISERNHHLFGRIRHLCQYCAVICAISFLPR
jgi:hypothetical protein